MNEVKAHDLDLQLIKAIIVKGTPEEAAVAIFQAGLIKIEDPMTLRWELMAKAMNEVAALIGRVNEDITEEIARQRYMLFAMKYVMDKKHKAYKENPIYEVEAEKVYISESGFLFRVLGKARHGQDCSEMMIHYTNLEPTADMPAGEKWVIAESIFLKRFYEVGQWRSLSVTRRNVT